MTRKRITSKSFHAINRTIKEQVAAGKYTAEKVAKLHNVGVSTVRAIKAAKTWPGYQRSKAHNLQKRGTQVNPTKSIAIKPNDEGWTKASAERSDLKVTTPTPKPVEKQLSMDLEKLDNTMPRSEVEDALRHVHERIDVLSATYRMLAREPLFRLLFGRKVAEAIRRQEAEAYRKRVREEVRKLDA